MRTTGRCATWCRRRRHGWGDNWEYIAGGALIVGGIAVMASGVGGPIGAAMVAGALMSAGGSAGMQKYQHGSGDWGQVAIDGAVGGVAGMAGAGVAAARAGARTGMSCLGRNVMTGAAAGAAGGGVSGGMSYATSGQQMTAAGCSPKCPVQPASPPAPTCCSVTAPPSRSKTSPSATTYSPPTRRPVRRSRPEPKPSKRCRHLSPEEPGWRADAERPSGAEAT